MFNIGDKIFYPVQGAGIIEIIEEKEFHGEKQKFYNISLINNSMKLMMPSNRMETSNIRPVSSSSYLNKIFLNINKYTSYFEELSQYNAKQRIEINTDKMKKGSLEDLVQIIYALTKLKKEHSLNSSENQLLLKAKKLLTDEICLSMDLSKTDASDYVEEKFKLA